MRISHWRGSNPDLETFRRCQAPKFLVGASFRIYLMGFGEKISFWWFLPPLAARNEREPSIFAYLKISSCNKSSIWYFFLKNVKTSKMYLSNAKNRMEKAFLVLAAALTLYFWGSRFLQLYHGYPNISGVPSVIPPPPLLGYTPLVSQHFSPKATNFGDLGGIWVIPPPCFATLPKQGGV